ncbi:TRAP transporter small permease [Roseovarius spongiae]|uniref:TRAP transporter small permease protein n=1 Tax=Roseovarius spongiae TaxID=2320272 RepID=A0A3A8B1X0_9RHOB|nr:TRAP transporter small permease [Roseovarius spongiae]
MRWADTIANLLAQVAAGLAVAMSGFVALSAIMRYLFGAPFSFTEELVGLLFTAMIFAGIPACTLRRSHISVTIIPDLLPKWAQRQLDRLAHAVILFFCIWFGKLTWDYMQLTISLNARSSGVQLILWPWTAALPLSCFMAGLAALIRIAIPYDLSKADAVHRGSQ